MLLTKALTPNFNLILLHIDPLLKMGIALPDIKGFLEQPKGKEYLSTACTIIPMKVNQIAWVPFGYLPVPLSKDPILLSDDTDETKKAADKKAEPLGAYLTLHIPFVPWAQDLKPITWTAVSNLNIEELKEQKGSMWRDRLEAIEAFSAKVVTP